MTTWTWLFWDFFLYLSEERNLKGAFLFCLLITPHTPLEVRSWSPLTLSVHLILQGELSQNSSNASLAVQAAHLQSQWKTI